MIDVYNIDKNESLYVYSDTFQEITTSAFYKTATFPRNSSSNVNYC